jgi:hypothetical protein
VEEELLTPRNATEVFYQAFPEYLKIGVTTGEFWDEDVAFIEAFRSAYQYEIERRDRDNWMLGAYVHNAVGAVVGNATSKKKYKYLEKPMLEGQFAKKKSETEKGYNGMLEKMKQYTERHNAVMSNGRDSR